MQIFFASRIPFCMHCIRKLAPKVSVNFPKVFSTRWLWWNRFSRCIQEISFFANVRFVGHGKVTESHEQRFLFFLQVAILDFWKMVPTSKRLNFNLGTLNFLHAWVYWYQLLLAQFWGARNFQATCFYVSIIPSLCGTQFRTWYVR